MNALLVVDSLRRTNTDSYVFIFNLITFQDGKESVKKVSCSLVHIANYQKI